MSYGTYRVHPMADRFPLLDGAELDGLAASIKEGGLLEPIVLSADGTTILDGRNRWRACEIAGVTPRLERFTADDELAEIRFIVALNMRRRHLTVGQRALLGVEVEVAYAAAAKQTQGDRNDLNNVPAKTPASPRVRDHSAESREKAAADVGVSGRAVSDAKAVLNGAPDLAEEVRSGAMALGTANGLLGEAERLRLSTGNTKAHCVAAAAVEIINRGRRGPARLQTWWRAEQ